MCVMSGRDFLRKFGQFRKVWNGRREMDRRRWVGLVCAATVTVLAAVSAVRAGGPGAGDGKAGDDTPGFRAEDMDKSCKACDDFFQYANGNWIKNNPIPPEYASWGSGM